MPNIQSAKKRMIQSLKRKKHNTSQRSMLRTFIKKVLNAINLGNKNTAKNAFFNMQIIIDRLANKKLIHKNKSARHKSKLIKRINNMK
ncbi:30S ribosomal protein S20 [Blochmannia endosymbiont of Polyrhachis (Hedomyrma) turneri]|uniref:30S ribosomal protein S20 n=1 Tax=Blochmannia endosymbiont of Polyrhachis (Hedomyrma) turneri TaxID=1505596 RepID=UPI00061A8328|nr:30S ribosomal protein S20 [Blochmannia endosymbiont of Polyrhachis (Hedomyrma) turneri]AKC59700.1 30S ribosomal protein S20 [Blochmannia endosymbiont of Polyrhachis (Hedomyrma) turneri]